MSRFTKRDKYGHAYTNETIYDRGMTSEDGVHFEKHYFENGTSAYDGKPIDRLCELEDKIEQGELVAVVRCKDCRYCEEAHYEEEGEKPYIKLKCKWSNYSRHSNDYCSYGERREQ